MVDTFHNDGFLHFPCISLRLKLLALTPEKHIGGLDLICYQEYLCLKLLVLCDMLPVEFCKLMVFGRESRLGYNCSMRRDS
jgi:hypothetical protein